VVRKLDKLDRVEAPDPVMGSVFHIPSLDMVFQVFPFDRRLRDLALVGTEFGRRRLAGWLGANPDDRSVFTPARHRLGLSASVRSVSGHSDHFLKFHPAGGAVATVRQTDLIADRLRGAVQVLAPQQLIADRDITFTRAICGRQLDALDAGPMAESLPRVAADLASVHAVAPDGAPDRRSIPSDRARRAVAWLPRVMPAARSLVQDVWRVGADVGSEIAMVHGDMKPEHVVVTGGDMHFIDLDSAGAGRPTSDLASLASRLPVWAARELCSYYRIARPGSDRSGWAGEWALAGLKYALFHAQHPTPGWESRTIEALERALRPPPL
jgi:hypothetical protein